MNDHKRKYHKKATEKQLMALQLINNGMNGGEAMLKAGYSKTASRNPKRFIMQSQAITSIVDKLNLHLRHEGITEAYIATKFREWLEAQKTTIDKLGQPHLSPDYQTQIKAYENLKDTYGLTPKQEKQPIKRLTIEEFIQDTPSPENSPQNELHEATEAPEVK